MNERCPVILNEDGMRCILPAGHPGDDHEYEMVLPPELARLIGSYVDQLEEAHAELLIVTRKARRWARWSLAVTVIYLLLVVWMLVR